MIRAERAGRQTCGVSPAGSESRSAAGSARSAAGSPGRSSSASSDGVPSLGDRLGGERRWHRRGGSRDGSIGGSGYGRRSASGSPDASRGSSAGIERLGRPVGPVVRRRLVRLGLREPALGGRLVEQDRSRDGGVERLDAAVHRDAHEQVAAAPDGGSQAAALAAHDDRDRSPQVGLSRRQRRVAVGAHDPQAAGVQVGERAGKIVHGSEPEVLDRTRRRLHGRRGQGRLAMGREDGAVDAGWPPRCAGACPRSAGPRASRGRGRGPARTARRLAPGPRRATPSGAAPRRARCPGGHRSRRRP